MSTLMKVLTEYYSDNLLPNKIFQDMIQRENIKPLEDDESFYTPIYADIDNFDVRHNLSVSPPVYLNDFDFNKQEDREKILELLRTEFKGNTFDTVASCGCGKYRSNAYVGSHFHCDSCGTKVTKPLIDKIDTKVWLRKPDKVSGYLVPAFYATFLTKLNSKTPKVNIPEYWMNKDIRREKRFKDGYSTAGKMAKRIQNFQEYLNIPFGYNSFIDNMDLIIMTLLEEDPFRILDLTLEDRENYIKFWKKYKDRAVSNYFPLPNKLATIVESDNRNKYYTREQIELNNIFETLADLYRDGEMKVDENEHLVGKMYPLLNAALEKVQKNVLYGKKGMIRYHSGAGKLPFTGRSIITGASGVCRTDVVTVPWQFGITCLDKHLTNWLYRKGYAPMEVDEIIRKAAYTKCPIVEEFFDWIETNNYAVAILGRNPSIQYLSARAFIIRFNRDIDDKSIRIPITTVGPFGADKMMSGQGESPDAFSLELLETSQKSIALYH